MNYQPQSSNYYERLGIEPGVSENQIKVAFFSAVREYPPEKEAQSHKLIREAYDILIHPQSRNEYETRLKYGDRINELEEILELAVADENLVGQEKVLKKLILIAPKFGIYRNKLGLVYLELEIWDGAFSQFEKATKIDSDNPVYYLNTGFALQKMENFSAAEKQFLKAYELDPDDYSPPRALASLYFFDYDNADKAHEILDVAINSDGKIDFQDFFCIYDKLQFYTFKGEEENLKSQLTVLNDIATNDYEKSFASFMLGDIALKLYDIKFFDLAETFIKEAIILTPDDEDTLRFKREITNNVKTINSLLTIQKSRKVHDFIKYLITIYVSRYYGEIEDEEFDGEINKAIEIMENAMEVDPHASEIQESLAYIQRNHPQVYSVNDEFFDMVQRLPSASSQQYSCPNCSEQFNVPKYDYGNYSCPACSTSVRYDSSGLTNQSSSSDCYIATAVYGDCGHENVITFRNFRDNVLLHSTVGKSIVDMYYQISPPLARRLYRCSGLSTILRKIVFDRIALKIEKFIK